MSRTIGLLATEHVATALVEEYRVAGPVHVFPEGRPLSDALLGLPPKSFGECLRDQIQKAAGSEEIQAIGVGIPGIVQDGIVQDSPNLQQIKGLNLQEMLKSSLLRGGQPVPVRVFNDADVIAAGIAATHGQLNQLIRAWTIGHGIGFGRFPWAEGVWEGGHSVVTLDPKEHFCGCGGRGHLEGIMGHRAMRLRFLDMEPEEVFAAAKTGDARCSAFVKLWHRALAAATATSIHMEGPGKFFITGPNAHYVEIGTLNIYVHEMVKMSPLQGSQMEIISTSDEIGIIGAAVNAEMSTAGGH
ncbi:MAG TPA: ROK family protein [Terriglobia bacterium]|nr:ROK family protein [Terriglobia bacterium]